MGGDANVLTSRFEVYVNQFHSSSETILNGASAPFRNVGVLDKPLSDLKDTFEEADAALDKYGMENTPLPSADEIKLSALGAKLKVQIEAVVALFPDIEAADLKYIQSAKVATLDQPALKGLEAKLKTADEAFAKNLSSMIPPQPGEQPPMPTSGADFPDTFAGNLTNVRAPNQTGDG